MLIITKILFNAYNNAFRSYCPTYEPGKLLLSSSTTTSASSLKKIGGENQGDLFEIETMEVWGVGGQANVEKALQAQKVSREIVDETIRKARTVDKGALFNNEFNQEFLLSGTFQHRGQTSDRS